MLTIPKQSQHSIRNGIAAMATSLAILCASAASPAYSQAAAPDALPPAPGTLLERPQFMREGGTSVMDRFSRPYRLPDGTFITRADTWRGGDWHVNDYNSTFRAMKLDRHGKVIKSFAKTQVGRGIKLGGRLENWVLSVFSYLGDDRVAFTSSSKAGWGARGRATIVFNARTGRLDRSFGKGGKRIEHFPENKVAYPAAAVAGPEGRLLECGWSLAGRTTSYKSIFGYVRQFTRTGSLDPSFGPGGVVTTHIQSPWTDSSNCSSLARDPSTGELLVGGYDRPWTQKHGSDLMGSWIRRYDASGRLDTSFGSDGVFWEWKNTAPNRPVGAAYPTLLKVLPDRSVLVSSYWVSSAESKYKHATLFKLTPEGKLDTSFAAGGFDINGATNVVELQPDGKILVGGWRYGPKGETLAMLLRLLPNGNPDPTWTGSDLMAYALYGGAVNSIFLENGFARTWNFRRYYQTEWRNGAWDGKSMFRSRYARIAL